LEIFEAPPLQTEKEIDMALDLSNAGPQADRTPVPAGVYKLRASLKDGTAGPDFQLKPVKNKPAKLMLVMECSIIDNPKYDGKRVWDYLTVELDRSQFLQPPADLADLEFAVRQGQAKLKAIIQSACGLKRDDNSEAAQAIIRRFSSYSNFDGIEFYAQVEVMPAKGEFKAKNTIDFIVLPNDPDYPEHKSSNGSGAVVTTGPAPQTRKGVDDDMDDELPY
jgi:hypothetical protein